MYLYITLFRSESVSLKVTQRQGKHVGYHMNWKHTVQQQNTAATEQSRACLIKMLTHSFDPYSQNSFHKDGILDELQK